MKAGDVWNGWIVDSLIGEGRFGKVYKIVRTEFGHTYESALKVMRIPGSDAEINAVRNEGMDEVSAEAYFHGMVEEIVSEFTLMSEFRGNSNIVSYEDHQVIKHENEPVWDIYIRMELLTPLTEHIHNTAFTTKDVIKLGIDMCLALELCQSKSIIHRDIKPENIFFSKTGNYKLGDFGIAREMSGTSAMTRVGTPAYMAPEIAKGFAYNSKADLYSLGIVLYRFLNNNRLPFLPPYPQSIGYRDREEANKKRMRGELLPPPCNAGEGLSRVVLKACSYKAENRYNNAEEMRKALESVDPNEKLIEPKQINEPASKQENGTDLKKGTPEKSNGEIKETSKKEEKRNKDRKDNQPESIKERQETKNPKGDNSFDSLIEETNGGSNKSSTEGNNKSVIREEKKKESENDGKKGLKEEKITENNKKTEKAANNNDREANNSDSKEDINKQKTSPDAKSADEEKSERKKEKKKGNIVKKIIIAFLILIVVLAGLAGAAFYLTDYYLVYFTPDYEVGEISEEDAEYGFNGSWGYDESKTKKLSYGEVTAYVPTNWRRLILDMSDYGVEAEGRQSEIRDENDNRIAWFKIELLGQFDSLEEFDKSERAVNLKKDGEPIELEGCDEARSLGRFNNQDGETVMAMIVIIDGKAYWIGGGAVGENFSITNYTKMLNSCEFKTKN